VTSSGGPLPPASPRPRSGGAILARGCWIYVAASFVASLAAALMAGLLGTSDVDLDRVPALWILAEAGAFLGGFVLVAFVGPAYLAARRRREPTAPRRGATSTDASPPPASPAPRSGGTIVARGCGLYVIAIGAGFVALVIYALVVSLIHGDDVDERGFLVGAVLADLAGMLLAIVVLPAWFAARRRRRAAPPPA